MTENEKDLGNVEQITSAPKNLESSPNKENKEKKKDPKKVAAGKALAKKNKEAREALKRSQDNNENSTNAISPLSFLDVNVCLIGSILVIYHGYRFFYPPKEESKVVHEMVETNQVEEPAKEPKQETKANIDME